MIKRSSVSSAAWVLSLPPTSFRRSPAHGCLLRSGPSARVHRLQYQYFRPHGSPPARWRRPVPEMVKSAQRLESIGADLLIMPCNTAHNFYDAVASSVSIPVLHMIAITRDALKSRGVKCARSPRDRRHRPDRHLPAHVRGQRRRAPHPDHSEDQAAVMDIIYNGVKARRPHA